MQEGGRETGRESPGRRPPCSPSHKMVVTSESVLGHPSCFLLGPATRWKMAECVSSCTGRGAARVVMMTSAEPTRLPQWRRRGPRHVTARGGRPPRHSPNSAPARPLRNQEGRSFSLPPTNGAPSTEAGCNIMHWDVGQDSACSPEGPPTPTSTMPTCPHSAAHQSCLLFACAHATRNG